MPPARPLLLGPSRLEDLRSRRRSDPALARLLDDLRSLGDATLQAPAVPLRSIPFHQFGIQILETAREVSLRLLRHAFLRRLDDDPRHLAAVRRELENALSFPDWNPSHFLDTAEFLLGFALAYDWLRADWTPPEAARLREAIITRGLLPGLAIHRDRSGPSAFFPEATSNWNSVSNAGLIAGALAVQADAPDLAAEVLAHAAPSLRHPLSAFEPDGGSEEGPTYWSYGANFIVLGLALLEEAGLPAPSAGPGFSRASLYLLHCTAPSCRNFDYADCWPVTGPEIGLAWLATRHGPPSARRHVRNLVAGGHGEPGKPTGGRLAPLLALFLPPPAPETEAAPPPPLHAVFRGLAQIALFRSAWADPLAAWLGFKAGSNLANHAHLDLGSFVYEQGGVRWARDFGPDDYGLPGYFKLTPPAPWRWSYLRNTNHAHNTLTLGDDLQPSDAVADLIAHGDTWAIADLSAACPAHAAAWRRGVRLRADGGLLIRDELTALRAGTPARWALHTDATVTLAPGARHATLRSTGRTLTLQVALAPAEARLALSPPNPAHPGENPNTGVTRITLDWLGTDASAEIEIHLVPGDAPPPPALPGPALADWR